MSFHWSRDCLFSKLFRLTATKRQRLLITARGPSNANELPLHKASDIESVSMLWRQLEGRQPSFIISLVVVRWLKLYTSLNWVAFRLGNGLGLVWWWGQQIYLDQFCWWLLQYARATTILRFVLQLVRAYSKENIKAKRSCSFVRLMYYREFPLQRASSAQVLPWHDVIMGNSNILKKTFLYFIHWWPVYCFNEDYESSVWQLLSSLAAPWVVVMATCGVTVMTLLVGSWRS